MNGLAGLNSYEADDQKLAYKVKVLKIKDKDIYLATKTKLIYSFMFRVVTFGSENWTLCKGNQWKLNTIGM